MFSPSNASSPRGSRASSPIIVEDSDYGYVPQDFNDMLYQMQTDRACMPYSIPSDQLLLAQSEAGTIEHMIESGLYTNARAAIDAAFEREGIPPHAVAHMADAAEKEAELCGLPPYSPAWTSNHNTVVVPNATAREESVPPAYVRSHSETPSLCTDAEASSSSSSSGIATPADIFMRQMDEEEEQERVTGKVRENATVAAGPSGSRKRSRTVSTDEDDLDFEPHVVSRPQPRKRARVTRRAVVDSETDSSDGDEEERSARKQKSAKRGRTAKPVTCRCGHDKCKDDAGFSSVRVYERHYRSVHLGQASDVECGGCGLTFESGRKDSVLRHQTKNNQRQCLGAKIIFHGETRSVPVPRAIML